MAGPSHRGIFVVHEEVDELHPHGESSHTEHGLTFLVDGWFRMEHGGPVKVEAGSIAVIPAGVPHRPLEGRDMEYWLVGFCATCLQLDESQLLMSPFRRVRHGALPVVPVVSSRRRRRLVRPLADVASAVHRTSAHVTATVKKQTGYSVGEWINSGRVAEAANRLAHTDDALGDIARHVGWQDTTHFIRQFRKAYGTTPAAWRRELRDSHARGM